MNTERMLELADVIEGKPHESLDGGFSFQDEFLHGLPLAAFNMATFTGIDKHSCKTVGCIAGHAAALYGEPEDEGCERGNVAQRVLELTDDEADDLFVPPLDTLLGVVEPAAAAKVLRLAAQGMPIIEAWQQIPGLFYTDSP